MHSELATRHSQPATNPDEVLVRVEGVSKKFCRSLKRSLWYGLCDIAGELNPFAGQGAGGMEQRASTAAEGGSNQHATRHTFADGPSPKASVHVTLPTSAARDEDLREGEFYAVRDVSFELRRGECLGLIGHNGAGKTTLLKMLNGLVKPDRGRIEMNGRVGALIALGAGFNPILTGRENIYINGSVLGLSKKEIDGKIDEIIDFAEIGQFIDSPVQNYSSGMSVRLGFAIASSLDPDVLILDEVLAVGDIGFVIKCLNRVRQLTSNAAVIFVSHQMQFVSSFCSRVLFMDHGHVELDAREPKDAIDRYFSLVKHERQSAGLGTVEVHEAVVHGTDTEGRPSSEMLAQGCRASVDLDFSVHEEAELAKVSVSIDDESAAQVITCPLVDEKGAPIEYGKGRHKLQVDIGRMELNSGKYSILVGASGSLSKKSLTRSQGNSPFRVIAKTNAWSKIVRPIVPSISQ